MTEPTNTTPEEQARKAAATGDEKFDFRSVLSPEAVAALKARTPAFAKKILADISALTKEAEKVEKEEVVEPVVVVTVDPREVISVPAEDYDFDFDLDAIFAATNEANASKAATEEPVVAPVEEPESKLTGIFNKIKAKASDPVGTFKTLREETIPKLVNDLDENIVKLEEKLTQEQEKIKLESEFNAQLEDVLEHFKARAAEDDSLLGTIAQVEKKLRDHKLRTFVRHNGVPQLQQAIKAQRAIRATIAAKLAK